MWSEQLWQSTKIVMHDLLQSKHKILFVCTGNICRSPSAEGVFRKMIEEHESFDGSIYIDSCGTHSYHIGQSPDVRAQHAAVNRGVDISKQMARQIEAGDFDFFDYILVMDNFNLNVVHSMVDETYRSKIHLFLDYAELNEYKEVPDPYYGGEGGFEIVLDLLEQASIGLIKHLQSN